MMTSSNGNIFRVTGHLCGEFTGPGEFPAQRPVTRSFDVFFDLHPNKRLSKQWWGWWFETQSWPLWRHRNGCECEWINSHCNIEAIALIEKAMAVHVKALVFWNFLSQSGASATFVKLVINQSDHILYSSDTYLYLYPIITYQKQYRALTLHFNGYQQGCAFFISQYLVWRPDNWKLVTCLTHHACLSRQSYVCNSF